MHSTILLASTTHTYQKLYKYKLYKYINTVTKLYDKEEPKKVVNPGCSSCAVPGAAAQIEGSPSAFGGGLVWFLLIKV
jgi:hypothetical protein